EVEVTTTEGQWKTGDQGTSQVRVRLVGPQGHGELWQFFSDTAAVRNPWTRAQRITGEWDQVVGPGVIIQSDFKSGDHGNFEVVVDLQRVVWGTCLGGFLHNHADGRNVRQRAVLGSHVGEPLTGPFTIRDDS